MLRKKYKKISKLIGKMMSNRINSRPNCDQILRNKVSWALDTQKLKKLAKAELNELKPTDKSFYSTFMQIKLRNEPEKEEKSFRR